MERAINFRTEEGQEEYAKAYDATLRLWDVEYSHAFVPTSFGQTHCLICGNKNNPPLVLLPAASCGATMWYSNVGELSKNYAVYAVDLMGEPSVSILRKPMKAAAQCAQWLSETVDGLGIGRFDLCGLSVGGWNAVNYTAVNPQRIKKLILLSPIQTFANMHFSYFVKIMKMGFRPSRESVEEYLGWGSAKEAPLPDSLIEQFTISALNINSNCVFPRRVPKKELRRLNMPVLVLFGENEFAFDVRRAANAARAAICNATVETVKHVSHLIAISAPDETNKRIHAFLTDS